MPRIVERAPVDRDRIRGRGAVEAEARVVDVPVAVEGYRGIATGVIDAAGQALDARDQCAEVLRIAADAAPGRSAVVGEVGAGISIAQCTAWSAVDSARPRPGHVVIRAGDYAVGIVRIDRDRRLVLRRSQPILIDG